LANKIPYIDNDGQPQVLGRSLLASTARLTDPYPPLMQRRLLEYFRVNLAQANRLVAIGYSMNDGEVNEVLCDWLGASRARQLEIVAPGIARVPSFLEPLSRQVELTPASATTYLESVG
jgi:hypothetical protein